MSYQQKASLYYLKTFFVKHFKCYSHGVHFLIIKTLCFSTDPQQQNLSFLSLPCKEAKGSVTNLCPAQGHSSDKKGALTADLLVEEWGPLITTWCSTDEKPPKSITRLKSKCFFFQLSLNSRWFVLCLQ